MTRTWQLLTAAVAAVGLIASLVLVPLQPYDEAMMSALAQTGATIEDRELPDFQLFTASGEAVSSASFEGRSVYLTFWAEWCDVCKSEMPSLDALARNQADAEVVMVAVDDEPAAAFRYLQQAYPNGTGFRLLLDPGARVANGVFGTTGVPETFLIDPDGHLVARYVGGSDFARPVHTELAARLAER